MPRRDRPQAHYDAAEIWETARQNGGLRYQVPTLGAAVSMRQKLYAWRKHKEKLLDEREGIVPGISFVNDFSAFIIRMENVRLRKTVKPGVKVEEQAMRRDEPYQLVITMPEHTGVMLDLDGQPIEPTEPELPSTDSPLGLE